MNRFYQASLPWLRKLREHAFTLIVLGLMVYFWFRPFAWVADQMQPTSSFHVQIGDASTLRSEDLRGKVVLVNFWATWCPFCRNEMPAMETFYREYKDQGFEIIAVSIENDANVVREFVASRGYSFPVALSNDSITRAFSTVESVPVSFVLDKRGIIRKKISGQVHIGRLEDTVLPLLKE